MLTPSANHPWYAKGWQVNAVGNRWHSGCLDGTATYWVRTATGLTWAILLNTRHDEPAFWENLDRLGWTGVRGVSAWPTHNLLLPEQNAAQLTGTPINAKSTLLKWANGTGNRRLVVMKAGSPVDEFPLDGTQYTPTARFGQGGELGAGNFVVADGEADTVVVKNLDPNHAYFVRVIEYFRSEMTSDAPLYALEENPTMILNEQMAEPYLAAARPVLQVPTSAFTALALQLAPTAYTYGTPALHTGRGPASNGAAGSASNNPLPRLRESGRAVLRRLTKG